MWEITQATAGTGAAREGHLKHQHQTRACEGRLGGGAPWAAHAPGVGRQRALGRRPGARALRRPGVGPELLVVGHHAPLLPPVAGLPDLLHLAGGAVHALLLLGPEEGGRRAGQRARGQVRPAPAVPRAAPGAPCAAVAVTSATVTLCCERRARPTLFRAESSRPPAFGLSPGCRAVQSYVTPTRATNPHRAQF